MKKLSFFLLPLIFLTSCEDFCPKEPQPKYGNNYDDYSTYDGDDCYVSNTYTYYCHNGRYRSITHTKVECCDTWEKNEYTSGCLSQSQQDELGEMTELERQLFYETL